MNGSRTVAWPIQQKRRFEKKGRTWRILRLTIRSYECLLGLGGAKCRLSVIRRNKVNWDGF